MNKLPFKLKIIASISVLFILLILPSRTTFVNYIEKNDTYSSQLVGLSYNILIHNLIQSIQRHRGLSNGYINGDKTFKKAILNSEKQINQRLSRLVSFDDTHLTMLRHNKEFANALSQLELIYFVSLNGQSSTKNIFKIHSNIIALLIKSFQEISLITSFANNEDKQLNYIAQMLQEKLLLLEENIGQLRGRAVGIFAQTKISKEQKSELLSIYTLIKSLEANLLDNHALIEMDNYLDIQKMTTKASYKLNEILHIANKNIIMIEKPTYDSKLFFRQATSVINEHSKLYRTLAISYEKLVKTLQKELFVNFVLVLTGFFIIILFALYIFGAFYSSIATSLKKLQSASEMIAQGKTDIHLEADTQDEIGNALLAFNHMSQKLNENISFLDGYKMAIDETSIVSKTDPRGVITYVNKLFCEISGYSEKELIGMSHNVVRHPDMPKETFKKMWETVKAKKIWHGVVKNRTKDGNFYIVDATIIPVLDSSGEIIEFIGVRHDVTELEKSKEEIKKQKIDLLTGLPNRSQLLDDLQVIKKPILLYLNIDDFANLNDFYGTKMGDNVLNHLASLLGQISESTKARLYKLHADEFLLLVEEGMLTEKNYQEAMRDIINHIEKETVECDSKSCISVTLSGGIAFYQAGENYENLLTYASLARKMAKKENKKFLLYDNDMNKDLDYQNNIEWINKIKDAIAEDRLTTFFQPIIDNKTSAITKYESLVRMIDKEGKVISPFFFLEIAKKAKLYTKITKIVLDKTFATFEKLPQYDFSLNITVEDILDEETSSYIFQKLKNYPNADRVIFEITESEEIKDYVVINNFIKTVKSYGARIAIDDFGAGYANFEHIINLKADFIKIDGSLIKNIDTDENSRIITEAIIAFSKKLGSKTVVEYVHNEAVSKKVKTLGADFSQGFYLGEPSSKIVSIKDIMAADDPLKTH
jgi:PAS domain S-box-containing protein/diguanylate cyclase (GGDEF)-like protein